MKPLKTLMVLFIRWFYGWFRLLPLGVFTQLKSRFIGSLGDYSPSAEYDLLPPSR